MIILAIDPGIALCGFAFLEGAPTGPGRPLDYGAIETTKACDNVEESDAARLVVLRRDLRSLIRRHKPDVVAVEVFVPSPQVAHQAPKVLQARGVVLVEAAERGLAIHGYRPATVKETATGRGNAPKADVQAAVAEIYGIPIPKPDDAADALAVAYTHLAALQGGLIERSPHGRL